MILIVDGNNLGCRAHHALKATPNGIPVAKDGTPLAATQVVLGQVAAAMRLYKPSQLVIVFDNGGQTFRHEVYPEYKGNRGDRDESMGADVAVLRDICIGCGLGILAPEGYEADDAIATIASAAKMPVIIYSSDKDLLQMVRDDEPPIKVLKPGEKVLTDRQAIVDKFKLEPWQIPHYKALVGDSSDGIPGVKGIGAKMAMNLLERFGSVDQCLANLRLITGNPFTLLNAGKDDAALYLSLIRLAVDVKMPRLQFPVGDVDWGKLRDATTKLGLNFNFGA